RNAAKTDFATKSLVTRWMFRRMFRPLRDHRRHDAELAANQNEVGDRLCHLHAGPLRDPESRGLERRHVVDAVADHGDVVAGVPECLHEVALSLWCYATDDAGTEIR